MRYLIALFLISGLVFVPSASASSCPGSADPCPWTQLDTFGQVGPDEFRGPYGVAADAAGNLYVADVEMHRVQKLDSSGAHLKSWGGRGDGDGELYDPWDIAVDPVGGGVYVADNGNERVVKFDSDGKFVSAWGWGVADGTAAYQICTSGCRAGLYGNGVGQIRSAVGIATDGANVYVADANNKRIQKYDLAGNYVGAWAVPSGAAPKRIAIYGGKVYVTTGANTVWRFSSAGVPDTSWDGDGVMGSSGSGAGQFSGAKGIAVDATGVYVADSDNSRVQKLDAGGSPIASWGSVGSADGQLNQPWGIVATGGSVWVTEWGNYRLQKFSQAGVHQDTVGSPLVAGQYYWPLDIATSPSGEIIVADGDDDIQRLDASGNPIAKWHMASEPNGIASTANGIYAAGPGDHITRYDATGNLLGEFGSTGAGPAQFDKPHGIAADADGNLYVADLGNNRVQKLSPSGDPLASFGSKGSGAGQLSGPYDVALDSAGNVYVADGNNGRIEKFSPSGDFLTTFGTTGSGDGQLNFPDGVVVDRDGHVFVSDDNNNRIEEFGSNGQFLSKWGAFGAGAGELDDPYGLTLDADGAVWVVDSANHRILRFCCPAAKGGPAIGGGDGHTDDGTTPPPPGDGGNAADTTAPRIALSGRSTQRTRRIRRRGLALRLATSERATVTLNAVVAKRTARRLGLRGASIAHATASLAGSGTTGIHLRLSPRARRVVSRQARVRIVVRAIAADPAGNRSAASLTVAAKR